MTVNWPVAIPFFGILALLLVIVLVRVAKRKSKHEDDA